MTNQAQVGNVLFNKLQFEAQNARLTKSLSKDGATSSLFSLYLAMQIVDPVLHNACELSDINDESSYSSMNKAIANLQSAPRAKCYSTDADYVVQDKLYASYQKSSHPEIHLRFLNTILPQPLHYHKCETTLSEEVLANLPFGSQGCARQFEVEASESHRQNTHENNYFTFNSQATSDTLFSKQNMENEARLDSFINSIETSREYVL